MWDKDDPEARQAAGDHEIEKQENCFYAMTIFITPSLIHRVRVPWAILRLLNLSPIRVSYIYDLVLLPIARVHIDY